MTQFKKDSIQSLNRIFPGGCGDCGNELDLFDSVAQEQARLAGTRILFYSLRRAMNRHPLYKEPSQGGKEWSFHGPFEMWGSLEFMQGDDISPEASEYGGHKESDARLIIARKEFEDACSPTPKVGDVIEFWTTSGSAFEESELNSQWDVVRANKDGNIFGTEVFTQYSISLKRKTKFVAIRKTEGERI